MTAGNLEQIPARPQERVVQKALRLLSTWSVIPTPLQKHKLCGIINPEGRE